MKTVRALIYRDVVWSIIFVSVAFMSLFFFIDFLEELERVTRKNGSIGLAALSALLSLPYRFYELAPITVLIGTIYAMARLAQSSEFTILRTGGLGPGRALRLLLRLGAAFAVLTFVAGDYLAPLGEQQAAALRARVSGGQQLGQAGAWLKEHRELDGAPLSISINVASTDANGLMRQVRIFEHDAQGRLLRRLQARSAQAGDGQWRLEDVIDTRWPLADHGDGQLLERHEARLDWPTTLDERLVSAALSPIDGMTTLELWRYSRHLSNQEQTAQRHELLFWKRLMYPLACIVMVMLALPFAYLHARAGGISLKVFGGVMLGVAFVLLNNVVGHLGRLNEWTPWLAAAAPSLLFLTLSLSAYAWLVRYR
jgi:lipopolysaccharide export system permease protein